VIVEGGSPALRLVGLAAAPDRLGQAMVVPTMLLYAYLNAIAEFYANPPASTPASE
jgi:hypothetical protein